MYLLRWSLHPMEWGHPNSKNEVIRVAQHTHYISKKHEQRRNCIPDIYEDLAAQQDEQMKERSEWGENVFRK
jgi:hypothetical protein